MHCSISFVSTTYMAGAMDTGQYLRASVGPVFARFRRAPRFIEQGNTIAEPSACYSLCPPLDETYLFIHDPLYLFR